MKNNKILAAVLAACLCAPAFAQSDKTMESMGFSRIVRDPAAAAMGFAAKASDASPAWAAFGNPGLIPMTSTRFAASVSYQSWAPKAVKTGNLAAGVAYHPGRVGLTVGFAHQSGEAYEVVNNYGVSEGTYKPSDMIIGAGLGVQIVPSFSLGANVRFLSSNVSADDKYTSIGVDFLATWSQNGITVATARRPPSPSRAPLRWRPSIRLSSKRSMACGRTWMRTGSSLRAPWALPPAWSMVMTTSYSYGPVITMAPNCAFCLLS